MRLVLGPNHIAITIVPGAASEPTARRSEVSVAWRSLDGDPALIYEKRRAVCLELPAQKASYRLLSIYNLRPAILLPGLKLF